jgi:integrase
MKLTFGRTCWLAGVPLETIKDLLGHEDTKTTIQYLGINMDDKSNAMSQLSTFQNFLKHENIEPSQAKWWTDRDLCPTIPSGYGQKMP